MLFRTDRQSKRLFRIRRQAAEIRCRFQKVSAIHVRRFISYPLNISGKFAYPVERYRIRIVVQIDMVGSGDNQQFLVVSGQPLVRILAEISGVSLLAVNQQHGAADLPDIGRIGMLMNDRALVSVIPPLEFGERR